MFLVIMSSLMAISCSSWVMFWVMMEVNTLSMSTLISTWAKKENLTKLSSFSYLTIQLISSLMLMFSILFIKHKMIILTLLVLTIILKMGSWPLHSWLIKISSLMKLNSLSMKIMISWQKIIPLFIIPFFPSYFYLFIALAIITSIVPMVKLLPSSSMKTIIILSSINNTSWLIMSSILSLNMLLFFFSIYSLSLIISMSFFSDISKKSYSNKTYYEAMLILCNLGGLPPTAMFIAKVSLLSSMASNFLPKEILIIMIFMASLFIFHYSWISLNLLILQPEKSQILKKEHMKIFPITFSTISILLTYLVLTLGFSFSGFILMG